MSPFFYSLILIFSSSFVSPDAPEPGPGAVLAEVFPLYNRCNATDVIHWRRLLEVVFCCYYYRCCCYCCCCSDGALFCTSLKKKKTSIALFIGIDVVVPFSQGPFFLVPHTSSSPIEPSQSFALGSKHARCAPSLPPHHYILRRLSIEPRKTPACFAACGAISFLLSHSLRPLFAQRTI